jgi:hypothetical protein
VSDSNSVFTVAEKGGGGGGGGGGITVRDGIIHFIIPYQRSWDLSLIERNFRQYSRRAGKLGRFPL